jgi:hypothetical protein
MASQRMRIVPNEVKIVQSVAAAEFLPCRTTSFSDASGKMIRSSRHDARVPGSERPK